MKWKLIDEIIEIAGDTSEEDSCDDNTNDEQDDIAVIHQAALDLEIYFTAAVGEDCRDKPW